MITIDKEDLLKYISLREMELKHKNMGLSIDEKQATLLRGGFAELKHLRKAIDNNALANPQGGSQ